MGYRLQYHLPLQNSSGQIKPEVQRAAYVVISRVDRKISHFSESLKSIDKVESKTSLEMTPMLGLWGCKESGMTQQLKTRPTTKFTIQDLHSLNTDNTFGRDKYIIPLTSLCVFVHNFPHIQGGVDEILERWGTVIKRGRELTGREGKGCWKRLDSQMESPGKSFLNSTRTDFASRQFSSFLLSTPRFVLPRKSAQTAHKKYSKTLLVQGGVTDLLLKHSLKATNVQSHTPKDKVKTNKRNWMSVRKNITKEIHLRKERAGKELAEKETPTLA